MAPMDLQPSESLTCPHPGPWLGSVWCWPCCRGAAWVEQPLPGSAHPAVSPPWQREAGALSLCA